MAIVLVFKLPDVAIIEPPAVTQFIVVFRIGEMPEVAGNICPKSASLDLWASICFILGETGGRPECPTLSNTDLVVVGGLVGLLVFSWTNKTFLCSLEARHKSFLQVEGLPTDKNGSAVSVVTAG